MKPPRLELDHIAPRPRRRWPGYLVLAVALGVAGDLMLRYHETAAGLERHHATNALIGVAKAKPAASKTHEAEEKIARTAVRQLALPWAGLIRALEGATTPDVAVLQLQPEAQQQVLRINAEARDAAAMFRYLRALGAAKGLSEIHLVNHEIAQDDPQRPVRFAAQASFRGMR
jgi:Tfp pilus assembly protein PilN